MSFAAFRLPDEIQFMGLVWKVSERLNIHIQRISHQIREFSLGTRILKSWKLSSFYNPRNSIQELIEIYLPRLNKI